MHSAIECEKKYVDVYTRIDWVSIFRRARRRLPYRVINLQHSDILDLQGLSQQTTKNRKKDEDGNNVNWLLVKSFRYEKAEHGIIQYRYDYGDDFKRLNVRRSGRAALPADPGHAYQTRIPISEAKKKDLVKLCTQRVIPAEMHEWYKSLPTTSRTKERLPELAVDDSADDDSV